MQEQDAGPEDNRGDKCREASGQRHDAAPRERRGHELGVHLDAGSELSRVAQERCRVIVGAPARRDLGRGLERKADEHDAPGERVGRQQRRCLERLVVGHVENVGAVGVAHHRPRRGPRPLRRHASLARIVLRGHHAPHRLGVLRESAHDLIARDLDVRQSRDRPRGAKRG